MSTAFHADRLPPTAVAGPTFATAGRSLADTALTPRDGSDVARAFEHVGRGLDDLAAAAALSTFAIAEQDRAALSG